MPRTDGGQVKRKSFEPERNEFGNTARSFFETSFVPPIEES